MVLGDRSSCVDGSPFMPKKRRSNGWRFSCGLKAPQQALMWMDYELFDHGAGGELGQKAKLVLMDFPKGRMLVGRWGVR